MIEKLIPLVLMLKDSLFCKILADVMIPVNFEDYHYKGDTHRYLHYAQKIQ